MNIPRKLGDGVGWVVCVQERVQAGDSVVIEVLGSVGRQFGSGLSRLVQLVNPSMVVLGGRLGGLLGCVESVVRDAMLAETLPYMAESLEVVVSGSGDGRLRGCLAMVFDVVMKNPPMVDV